MYDASSLEELGEQVGSIQLLVGSTFKLVYVEAGMKVDYDTQRAIERDIGFRIRGKAEMRRPERWFGILNIGDRWLFGECHHAEAVWLQHNDKPQHYSTALSTRVARAVVNIAIPDPSGIQAIDPCCGIGTVVIEALSMGIDIVGYDINPLAIRGARVNLKHYELPEVVAIGDMTELTGHYDVAIVDLPYNLCSVLPEAEQLAILQSARRLAQRVVVITTETIDAVLKTAGFTIEDRCTLRKGTFARHIIVCK
jgi:tRNA G10  N-methylase Trm11